MTILDGMKISIVFSVIAQILLVIIFNVAMRKRYHISFTYLLIATCISIIYSLLASISYFFEMPQEHATNLYRIGLYLAFPGTILGVVGTWLLVSAFIASTSNSTPVDKSRPTGKWGP